jgi:hemerythrin-like metal-binding protein
MEPWNAGLCLGVAEADEAHRAIYELTSQAEEAMLRADPAGVKLHLDALYAASVAHFAMEEGQMAESRFPGAKAHREAHAAFMGEFGKIQAELAARGLSPLFRLWFGSRFIDWLRFHIKGVDVQFYRHWRGFQEEQARAAEAALAAAAKAGPPKAEAAPPAPRPKEASAPALSSGSRRSR